MKYIALLRGINVGGRMKVRMEDLRQLCEKAGLEKVSTYINSGNILFESHLDESTLVGKLEAALRSTYGVTIPVMIREAGEMERILENNPFKDANPSRVGVMYFANPVDDDKLAHVESPGSEQIYVSGREVYMLFPDGIGKSKLKLPLKEPGTVRNINTVRKLVERCRQ